MTKLEDVLNSLIGKQVDIHFIVSNGESFSTEGKLFEVTKEYISIEVKWRPNRFRRWKKAKYYLNRNASILYSITELGV